jgi:hypothetical protein
MPDRAHKKHQQRLKRKQKQLKARREQSGSPVKRIDMIAEPVVCYLNSDWRERGQATAWVVRRGPGLSICFATFFVDTWCAGLKDAWGRLASSMTEIDDAIERSNEAMDGTICAVELEEVRTVVLGAIRFAHQNGFRLPARCDRWVAFLGDAGDWREADLSNFGHESGKLIWVGPHEDLAARLVGSTVEEFLARPDVEYVLGGTGSWFNETTEEEEGEEFNEAEERELFSAALERAAVKVRQWLLDRGDMPEPRLTEAMAFTMVALARSQVEGTELGRDLNELDSTIADLSPQTQAELKRAGGQVRQWIASFKSSNEFAEAMALPELGDETD